MSSEACPCCGGTTWGTAHAGRVRAGREEYVAGSVLRCAGCGCERLAHPVLEDYAGDGYRLAYNGTADPEALLGMHLEEGRRQLELVGGAAALSGKLVVDIGCGPGAFLSLARSAAGCTVGIETQRSMHAHLLRHDLNVFSAVPEFLLKWRVPRPADVVVSFGVIEHLADPVAHLEEARACLKEGGTFWLLTDNLEDVLMRTCAPGWKEFFYRTAHRWYFAPRHVAALMMRAGFRDFEVSTVHWHPFSTFVKWHEDRRVTGPTDVFDATWKRAVERGGMGGLVTVKGTA